MMKTLFSEIYSLVAYGKKYDPAKVKIYYESNSKLMECSFTDILAKNNPDRLLTIRREKYPMCYENVEIPFHKIKTITHEEKVLLNRR